MNKAKKNELTQELKTLKEQMVNDEIRMNGGYSKTLSREIMPIDKEILRLSKLIEVKTIEKDKRRMIKPAEWEFQTDSRWLELANELDKEGIQEQIDKMQDSLLMVTQQRKKLMETMPVNKKRIEEIELLLVE